MKLRCTIALLLALAVSPVNAATAALSSALDASDHAFMVARDAFRAGDNVKLTRAASLAKGHVLEPYIEQWRLRMKLEDAGVDEIQDFVSRHEGSLPAEQLRSEWVKLLARKGEWTRFREQRALLVNADSDVACYSLADRWQNGDRSAAEALKPAWQSQQELPSGCAGLAEELFRTGRYGEREVWDRFRVLAEAGRLPAAKKLLERLPDRDVPRAKTIDHAAASSLKYLLQLPSAVRTRSARELAILALTRVAKNDPQLAAERLTAGLQDDLSAEEKGYVLGHIASAAARRHLPEALEWFAAAGDAALNDEQRAWHARAALRTGDWVQVLAAIDRMTSTARIDASWTYWQARAMKALGRTEEARHLFDRVAGEVNFYGRLAAEELGHPLTVQAGSVALGETELERVLAEPGIQRALALFRLDMRTEAVREWNWSIRGMEDRRLIAAAEIARRHEIWDRVINTADRTVALHDFSLRYPAPHRDIFGKHARARSLEEHLVLGLVRQESRFISHARSTAGASGLMQLMPATARWVAKKMGMKDFSWSKVTSVDTNAALGTYYLRQVLDDLNGQPILAAAAYNAGPGRARKWLGSLPLEGAIYIETIPFSETRDYVKKVMLNTLYYAAVHGGEPRSLKSRLGMVGHRSAVAETDTP